MTSEFVERGLGSRKNEMRILAKISRKSLRVFTSLFIKYTFINLFTELLEIAKSFLKYFLHHMTLILYLFSNHCLMLHWHNSSFEVLNFENGKRDIIYDGTVQCFICKKISP